MEIGRDELEELRLGALTAIDGLWFMEVEKRYGFEAALDLDLEVWKSYGRVLLKRLARTKGIPLGEKRPADLATVNFLLETLCRVDGTECEGEVSETAIVFRVRRCSWWDNLTRSGRERHVPCEFVDNTIFRDWLQAVDPGLGFEITRSLPRGDDHCEWTIKRIS